MELVTFLHIIFESGFGLFCVMAAIYIQLYDYELQAPRRVLTALLFVNAAVDFADSLAYFYRGDMTRTGYVMVRISNFAVFAGMFVLLALGCMLLEKVLEEKGAGADKRLSKAVYIICALAVLIIAVSRLFGSLYYFDEKNLYHRGPGYVLIPLLGLAAIALLVVRTVKERSALSRNVFIAFMICWLLPVAGTVFQIFYYGISLTNIANSIAILLILGVFLKEAFDSLSIRERFTLSGESIEEISGRLESFLEKTGTEKQNRIRIRFTIEDALINTWQNFGDPTKVRVAAGARFGKPFIRIDHEGDSFNPFSKTAVDDWSSKLLTSAGLSPTYSYSHGNNTVKIGLSRMRLNPAISVLIAIFFGLITGSLTMISLSPQDVGFVTEEILVPVYDLWNRILYSVSAPAMLFIVMSTMLDTREVSEQGGSSGRTVSRYFIMSLIAGIVPIAVMSALYKGTFSTEEFTRYTVTNLLHKFFSVIPENLLEPFVEFNSAQLILIGIVLAYAVMAVGQQASGLASFIHQLNMISAQLAQWIAGAMPWFTIFLTARIVLENNASLLGGILMVIPFAAAVSVVFGAVILLYVSARMDVSPSLILKKLWPSFVLTLKTGQVADSYALAEQCCRKELGIQKLFTQRMMPLGLVLYMPMSMIGMISFVMYAAVRSHTIITPVWLLTAIVFALILLVAAPPIPGINLLSYVVIIGQLGLGNEYIIAAMIFDIIFNLFASAANQMMLQLDLILQADRVGLLRKTKLTDAKTEE